MLCYAWCTSSFYHPSNFTAANASFFSWHSFTVTIVASIDRRQAKQSVYSGFQLYTNPYCLVLWTSRPLYHISMSSLWENSIFPVKNQVKRTMKAMKYMRKSLPVPPVTSTDFGTSLRKYFSKSILITHFTTKSCRKNFKLIF